ncbi:MAG: cupin domain-containing protein [Haloferacaceae archaeon]
MTDEASEADPDAPDGYRTVVVPELPDGQSPARCKKEIDEAVGATAFGCNLYEADAGEALPWGYHYHPDHEELFYVIAGELAVETPGGTRPVGADEAFFVPAGHRNRARAVADGTRVIAVGAPKATDGAVIEEECPDCGERRRGEPVRVDGDGNGERSGGADGRGDGTGGAPGGRDETAERSPTYAVRCVECGAEFRRIS